MFYTYQYCHPITIIPFYIGKGSGNRMYDHLIEAKYSSHKNKHFENSIKLLWKQGLDPVIQLLSTFEDEAAAYDEEERLIQVHGRQIDGGSLCNITLGGRGPLGRKHTEAAKEKMRQRQFSEETRQRMRDAQLGSKQSTETLKNECYTLGAFQSQRLRKKLCRPRLRANIRAIYIVFISPKASRAARAETSKLGSCNHLLES